MKTSVDPFNHVVTGGPFRLGGWADGTYLEVEREAKTFKPRTGADGEHTRARYRNRSAKFTLTFLQSSSSNDILEAFRVLDESGKNGGIFPLLVLDLNGLTSVFSSKTYADGPPKLGWSQDVETRVWTLIGADVDILIAGNADE